MKTILHIDMNSYFPSVEEVLNPNLKNKPVIVGGKSRRSVVSSANYKAREHGVKAAMPMYKALLLCPNAIVIEPTFSHYQKFHDKFIKIIAENFSDKIEDCSIDECFVDITKLVRNKSPKIIALKIQNMIKNKLGLKCSIGIAHNKFMAKMGSDYKKPLGITQMYKEDVVEKLWPLPIGEMYMVGSATERLLKNNGIYTIKDLALAKQEVLENLLGSRWEMFQHEAHGEGDDEVNTESAIPKSISSSETFLFDTNDYEEISAAISAHAHDVWQQLQAQKLQGKTVTLSIKTPEFIKINKSKTNNDYIKSFEEYLFLLKQIYDTNFIGKTIRLVATNISNLKGI